jgi:hypothetical protein
MTPQQPNEPKWWHSAKHKRALARQQSDAYQDARADRLALYVQFGIGIAPLLDPLQAPCEQP